MTNGPEDHPGPFGPTHPRQRRRRKGSSPRIHTGPVPSSRGRAGYDLDARWPSGAIPKRTGRVPPLTDLDLFAHASGNLASHFGLTEDGTPYVMAAPFATALGYTTTGHALRLLDDGEKGSIHISDGTPGTPIRSVIYEDGIWELIFRSTLPSARAIKSEVKQILRELRTTGIVDRRPQMTELEMAERYVAALQRDAEKARLLEIQAPKVAAWEEVVDRDGWVQVGDIARTVGVGRTRLFEYLREHGVLLSRPRNAPSAEWSKAGWAVSRLNGYQYDDGRESRTTVFSPAGVERLVGMLKRHGVIA